MEPIKVSIIVPVYNTETYLRKNLNSILNQTYKEIEVILINDGSTDSSGRICTEYEKKDNRVKVIHQKNIGVSAARNVGINTATGIYTQFVDSDDYLEPNTTEKIVYALNEKVDLMLFSYKKIYESKGQSLVDNHICPIEGIYKKNEFMNYYGEMHYKKFINSPCNKGYVTEIIKNNNLRFNEDINMGEDLLFNLEYIKVCDSVGVSKEILYNYINFNINSLTASVKVDLFKNQQMLFSKIRKFLLESNHYNRENERFVEISYTDSIISCFENIFHVNANFTSKDRKLNICEIVDDDCVKKNIIYFKDGGVQKHFIGFLIKNKSIHGIYFFFVIKKTLRNNFGPLFQVLKKMLELGALSKI